MFISWGFTEYCYYYMSSQIQGNHQKWKSRDMESKIYILGFQGSVHLHTCTYMFMYIHNLPMDKDTTVSSFSYIQ